MESPEKRTVEVLALPPAVDEELLYLYFENKRRSGGGPLESVEKKGDRAILVFETAQVAAQVLSKGHHVLHNVELSVRKPASKDPCRLLLQGINPNTCTEMIELYVENMLDVQDYTLHPSPGRDLILIHVSQPFSKDFKTLCTKISKRTLDGARVSLEQIDQTDSVFVENLAPGTAPDHLMLYFESQAGGNQKVKEVTVLSEDMARVSFVSFSSVDLVLSLPHKLGGADLVVRPYFEFLQPTQSSAPPDSGDEQQGLTETSSEDLGALQTSPPAVNSADSQPEPLADPVAMDVAAAEDSDDQAEEEELLFRHVAPSDPVKLALFQLSTCQQDAAKAHPDVTITVEKDGVHIEGTDAQTFEQVKHSVEDYFRKMAETHFTLEPEKAELLARSDVKKQLNQALSQSGSPAVYSVSDCHIAVTALSQGSADQACSFLKSQPVHCSIPMDPSYEGIFGCREWSEFVQALGFSSAKVSEQGGNIDVWTLKGMESEKQAAVLQFLTTPIERETIISMEPGELKYIQTHCHQLLADMDQVSIFPLEGKDTCGLKIHGQVVACQMAEEVLQGVVSSICTRTITVNAPGVTRFLGDEECKKIMRDMQTKFSVYINIKHVPWEPLPQQDIFETAWAMMSDQNFPRVPVSDSAQELKADVMQTDHNGATGSDLVQKTKTDVSTNGERVGMTLSYSDSTEDLDDMDLYSAEEPSSHTDPVSDETPALPFSLVDTSSGLLPLKDGVVVLPSELNEEEQLSLAIQYSMESRRDEEKELQKALEMSQYEASCSSDSSASISVQEAIKSANTLQLFVFATYNSDLIRVDIAFTKKVNQRQAEERLEHRTVKDMSEYHRKCLDMIKRKHAVEIEVQGTIITISGFNTFVAEALPDVKLLLEKIANTIADQDILRTVQWSFHDPASSDKTPYSSEVTVFLEKTWRMKLKSIDVLLDKQLHTINFEKMQETSATSGKCVNVSRKLINLDDLDGDVPEEEYSLLASLPDTTKINEESDEFQAVVKRFYETIQQYHSKIRIIQVEKLMNRLLYNQYKLKKASVLQHASYPEIERTLYHGTSETSVKEICVHGFNRSFCGKNATVYGQGVYFAVNSALSVQDQYSPPNAEGYKFVFVSKVLTGDYTKGCHSMKTAPLKETGDIPLRYDSVTDDITKPSMFVIFNDTQAFPEYLITCQRIHR
ncbi:uncharacterized protein V6R79_021806 [Siganus canaliculatus]